MTGHRAASDRPEAGQGRGSEGGSESGREAGFVLLSVLAVLGVVSAVLVTAILQGRASAALTGARAEVARLQGMADGIARLVAYDLAVGRTYRLAGLALPEDGSAVRCRLDAARTAILSLQDQGRLIDLNGTPRADLEEAFRLLGVPDRTALALAAEIVDFRDADDVPEPGGGAELPQYRALGLARGPRNAPFVSPEEIARLPSMTPEAAAILGPVLTVHNRGGRFDLGALIRQVRPAAATALPDASGPVPSPRQHFRISVVVADRRARAGRSAVFGLGGTRSGTDVIDWLPTVAPDPGAAADHLACPAIAAALGTGPP